MTGRHETQQQKKVEEPNICEQKQRTYFLVIVSTITEPFYACKHLDLFRKSGDILFAKEYDLVEEESYLSSLGKKSGNN